MAMKLLPLALCVASLSSIVHAAAPRPNFILMMGDDHGWEETGYNGHPHVKTPVLDEMAATGLRFDRFYAAHPSCSPTRASFLTGRHPNRMGTFAPGWSLRPEEITIAHVLSKAGYRCGHFGKWHVGPVKAASPTSPGAMGFQEWLSHDNFFELNPWLSRNGGPPEVFPGESSEILVREAIRFIDRARQDNRPFLAVIWFGSPHEPYSGLPADLALYDDLPAKYAHKKVRLTSNETGGQVERPQGEVLRERYAEITAMDRAIGQLRKHLAAQGLRDGTLLFYCGDNGTSPDAALGFPHRGRKGEVYEGGTLVPGLIEWPARIPEPRRTGFRASTSDLLPTLCALAGQPLPQRPLDGMDLTPVLDGRLSDRPGPLCFWEFNGGRLAKAQAQAWIAPELQTGTTPLVKLQGGKATRDFRNYRHPPVTEADFLGPRSILDGRFKLVIHEQRDGSPKCELFDLAADPAEKNNLLEQRPDTAKRLQTELCQWQQSVLRSLSGADYQKSTEPRRPNILFIIVDDQAPFDFRFYNPDSTLESPRIDRLAREGMIFDGAYHMGAFVSAVCTPSRYMIKSGRTLWHLPNAPEGDKHCPPDLEHNTIAAVFNRAGYRTMRTGKPGTSYEAAKRMFTVRRDSQGRSGTEPEGSAWHAQQVLDYLDQRAADGDRHPFLIYFGFSHPHDPRNGTPELLAKYGAVNHADPDCLPPAHPGQPRLPVNYLPAHPFPTTLLPDQRDETRVSGVWTRRDERTIRNELGREFACSENIDIQIGRVLDRLQAMGELENTYVFYTSDNGIAIGRHGLQGKQNLYQHSWRVPFIVKGPGIKPGSRVEGNIYLLDVLATLCELAGIPAPETNEGLSFKAVLEGKKEKIRDVLYGVHCGGTKPGIRCVKQGDWKLIKYDGNDGTVRETQLFNLAENPHEFLKEHHDPKLVALTGVKPAKHQVNLAGDPRCAGKLEEMESLLLAEMRRLHDPWRLWNQPDDGLPPPPSPPTNPDKVKGGNAKP